MKIKAKGKTKGKAALKIAARKAEPEITPNLRLRRGLMRQLAAVIKSTEGTQEEAGQRCGISQPRINDLLRGREGRFSLDALVNIAAKLGAKVSMAVERRK